MSAFPNIPHSFAKGKKKSFIFWLCWCDLSQVGSSGAGLEGLAGAEAVEGMSQSCGWC